MAQDPGLLSQTSLPNRTASLPFDFEGDLNRYLDILYRGRRLTISGDVEVRQNNPTTALGTQQFITYGWTTARLSAYTWITNVKTVIPAGAIITSVRVVRRVSFSEGSIGGQHRVRKANATAAAPLVEATLTWANQPGFLPGFDFIYNRPEVFHDPTGDTNLWPVLMIENPALVALMQAALVGDGYFAFLEEVVTPNLQSFYIAPAKDHPTLPSHHPFVLVELA